MEESGDLSPEPENDRKQGMKPREAALPITMMVVLIVATVALALFIGPVYRNLGLSAEKEYSDNPYLILIFVVMLIVISAGILILRKFLKRRNKKVMKIILSVVVAFSMFYVLTPLIDISINGIPPRMYTQDVDLKEATMILPLDPGDIDGDFIALFSHQAEIYHLKDNTYTESDRITDIENPRILLGKEGKPQVCGIINDSVVLNRIDDLSFKEAFRSPDPAADSNLTGSLFIRGDDSDYLLGIWKNDSEWYMYAAVTTGGNFIRLNHTLNSSLPETALTWGPGNAMIIQNDTIYRLKLDGKTLNSTGYISLPEKILWARQFEHEMLMSSGSSVYHLDNDTSQAVTDFNVINPSLSYLSHDGGKREILLVRSPVLYSIIIDGSEYKTDHSWYFYDAIGVFTNGFKERTYLISENGVDFGDLDRKERFQPVDTLSALLITIVLMIVVVKLPKWYIIDGVGILVGAGVLAFLGISIPVYLLMILMILLAVYDFVSVYITKHMIALADTVVEAKLPILLVFPRRFDFKYEEKKDLMESKRKGESMFMGLGDVIIPGSLVVASSVFLPDAGVSPFLGFIPPSIAVGLFTLAGMLLSFSALMGFVIKGKAHAGLPFLNTGAIVGFLAGHLIIYGNLIFF
jgi:presenilin-like A22 family membrane protease